MVNVARARQDGATDVVLADFGQQVPQAPRERRCVMSKLKQISLAPTSQFLFTRYEAAHLFAVRQLGNRVVVSLQVLRGYRVENKDHVDVTAFGRLVSAITALQPDKQQPHAKQRCHRLKIRFNP